MRGLSYAALLGSVPFGLAQHHYGPPRGGPRQGTKTGSGHGWDSSSTATSGGASSTSSSDSGSQSCNMITSEDIESAGNNTLFTRWRPHSHFMAPAGWMNDPCAPMYDPKRDVYHLFYQWHPQHINWGNISWGYATSKDMITWEDYNGWEDSEALALGPTGYGNYNGLGIFSGTGQPVNMQGEEDGTLLLFYTSVAHLPTNWQIEYQPFTETQSLAYSTDGGKTWEEYEGNPVINTTTNLPPMNWNVTGFRDPFFEPWPAMDQILGMHEPHYYAVFGSGIKGVGPRMPLWSAPASDLTDWTFQGALWEPAANTSLGPIISTATYGFNFEVSGFFSLPDCDGNLHYYIEMGTEGNNLTFHPSNHWALWNEGIVSRRENGSAEFTPIAGGAADWGLSYALTSFNDTKNNRRVQWAWAPEDLVGDSGLFSAKQQGFQGSLALPRELFVHETKGVMNVNGSVAYSREATLEHNQDGTFKATTLGIKPLADVVEGLVANASHKDFEVGTVSGSKVIRQEGSAHMELKASITSATGACGLIIGASPDMTEYTTISYQPTNNTIIVDRSMSSTIDGFNNASVTGYFHPYTIRQHDGSSKQEAINMDVFVDGSLVEIYINERFALATRIYPSMECSTGFGVYVGDGAEATFEGVEAWMGTLNVWPSRPLDSSSPLIWDTAAETNNYTWWSGN